MHVLDHSTCMYYDHFCLKPCVNTMSTRAFKTIYNLHNLRNLLGLSRHGRHVMACCRGGLHIYLPLTRIGLSYGNEPSNRSWLERPALEPAQVARCRRRFHFNPRPLRGLSSRCLHTPYILPRTTDLRTSCATTSSLSFRCTRIGELSVRQQH